MHSKRYWWNTPRKLVITITTCVVLVVCGLFIAVQIANANNKLRDSNYFGIGNQKCNIQNSIGELKNETKYDEESLDENQSSLHSYSTRDISKTIAAISEKQENAAKAKAAIERANELAHISWAKNKMAEHEDEYGAITGLTPINWDQGKAAFIAEWTIRLNKYFLGSPLANTGEIFAEAAWDKGIDPRWSPAISNTESSKGFNCFKSHNAWGWGEESWSNWIDAIWDHVDGLATKYGYTITEEYAHKYCPPRADSWYSDTVAQMKLI